MVLRRGRMSRQSRSRVCCGLLLLALGLTASCSSGTGRNSAAATAQPVASSVSAPLAPGTSPAQPPTHVVPTGGDPAIYAAAISEIQSYLTMEVQHGPYAAAAVYLAGYEQAPIGADTTWPVPDADPQMPVLVAGSVYSYLPWSWTSADQFTLYVTLDLHFRGDPARANWYEGHNTQFFTFSRADGPTPRWRLETGSAPYPEAAPNSN